MPLSINSQIAQIVAGQGRKPSPIHDAFQAIATWAAAGFKDSDIASDAAIAMLKTDVLSSASAGVPTLGYAEVTANQNGITTIVDLTSLSIAVTVPSGGRKVKITGFTSSNTPDTNGANISLTINEGGTQLNSSVWHATTGVGSCSNYLMTEWVGTPSAGAHTYKLRMSASAGTVNMGAAATQPAFIHVQLI